VFEARNLVAAVGPAVGLLLTWGAFEEPAAWGGLALAAALGVAPAAIARRAARVVCAIVVAVSGLAIAFRASPLGVLPWTEGTWLDRLGRTAEDGLRAFEVIVLPFDPARGPAMHALTQTAVLGFTLAASLAVAARRPLLAATVVVVGGGWATASMPDQQPLATGALLLTAAVWPTVVFRARGRRDIAVATAAVGVVGAIAVGAASAGVAPDEARLGWQSWSLFGAQKGTSVRYVWDAQYGGISFPARPTTLLRIRGPRRAHYWRASTLDLFTADRWVENLYPVSLSRWRTTLPKDPVLPAAAANTDPVEQTVEVAALDDDHLVATGQPLRVRGESLGTIFFLSGGVMRVRDSLSSGTRYTIWSYAPNPTPRQLLASKPRYPPATDRYRVLDRSVLPPFGAAARADVLDALFRDDRYFAVQSYRPLWTVSQRIARGARSPYEATLAVERWFRSTGGFTYSEQPPAATGRHPLVDFVVGHRVGYCQHFAGAMALMLRMLGVPARVAVGFTSGKWDGTQWIVSDTDAHAWVEAWFDGYGWLPFDPTPGRGSFSANYTLASDSADAVRALGRGELLAVLPESDRAATPVTPDRATPAVDEERRSAWPLLVVLGAIAIPVLLLVITKAARRRLRYRTRDPRRLAFAARSELIDVLRDQGVNVAPGADTQTVRNALERYVGVPGGAFADAHRRARYGPPAHAGRAAAEMRAELRTIKHVLREELALRRRLLGAVSLRSLRGA
jgi:transglutaminase-like putative cysteine protease